LRRVTRESIGGTVERSITADDVVAMLEAALLVRGAPGFIRCDNGPEFIAAAIRDWCRINRIETTYIDPGSPWQNPWVESFNSRARDELFAREIFDSVRQARFLYGEWAPRLQSPTATQLLGLPGASRLRPSLSDHHHHHRGTLVEGGPVNGVRSLGRSPQQR